MGTAVFERLLASPAPAFALLHRPAWTGRDRVEVLVGEFSLIRRLADLPLGTGRSEPGRSEPGRSGHELLAVVPYRQIVERGFGCRDDGEPIRVIAVTVGRNDRDPKESNTVLLGSGTAGSPHGD